MTGTSAGIANHLALDPVIIRSAFIVLAMAGGVGVVLYLAGWLTIRLAIRQPRSPLPPATGSETERTIGVGLVTLGLLLAARGLGLGFIDSLVWPVAVLAIGFVVAATQTDLDVVAASGVTGRRGTTAWVAARIGAGLALAVLGVVALFAFNVDVGAARDLIVAAVVVSLGLGLVLGPWIWRIATDLFDERRRRIRSEERTELAAQLHDSVLQTLALIQRHQHEPATMVQLARRQERELRSWLHGDGRIGHSERLREGIETAAAEVEELHGVPIEVVVVGDTPADDAVAGVIRAAREAMQNAARHSGTDRVDVYAEVEDQQIVVFVRDTGRGFDTSAMPADRRGVRDSIEGRMRRLGGTASVTSTVGDGTEVELSLPRRDDEFAAPHES